MKAFITKYALSQGIYEVDGEIKKSDGADYLSVKAHFGLFFRKEFFLNEDDAIKNALERRDRKVISLNKQIKKLNAMTF